MNIEVINQYKVSGGWLKQFTHQSHYNNCQMRCSIFLPPQAATEKVPTLYWLSGLTCSDENFSQKAAAFSTAAKLGMAIVIPDTSPRGDDVADDPEQSYDLGLGAGFYLNATQEPWKKHYQMYDYIVKELPELIAQNFPVSTKKSISGHSMGGHGALVIGLRNPQQYSSISAFSPICHSTTCPWGEKAFTAYLGEDRSTWEQYDATLLLPNAAQQRPIKIDQGLADEFLPTQLNPQALQQAAQTCDYPLQLEMREEYDHSYYFISSFIGDHLAFHHQHLSSRD